MTFVEMTGKKFGFWTVLSKIENFKANTRGARWLCKCICGKEKIVKGSIIRRGKSKSCGCWDHLDNSVERAIKKKTKICANGCIEWTGRCDKDGYAQYGEKGNRVHRIVYEKHNGPIQENNCICHTCDNPRCINIDHLWEGTNKQNNEDKVSKGRSVKGEKHHKSKLCVEDIICIKALYEYGTFQKKIAQKFNVSQSTISTIIRNEGWRHVK